MSRKISIIVSLLQVALEEKADDRLKNIVATIQGEQNNIIRADMNKALIVQGVAGSGSNIWSQMVGYPRLDRLDIFSDRYRLSNHSYSPGMDDVCMGVVPCLVGIESWYLGFVFPS